MSNGSHPGLPVLNLSGGPAGTNVAVNLNVYAQISLEGRREAVEEL